MLSVKLVDQFLRIPEILRRFPASRHVTVTCQLYETLELPVASFRVEDLVNFPFVRVVDDPRLLFRWRLSGGTRCIVVEQREMENLVFPDHIREVKFVSLLIGDLSYHVRCCSVVVELL
jgi:hypothetical protein